MCGEECERGRHNIVIIYKPNFTQHITRRRNDAKCARNHIIFAIIIKRKGPYELLVLALILSKKKALFGHPSSLFFLMCSAIVN